MVRALGMFSESLVADGQHAKLLGSFRVFHSRDDKTERIGYRTIAIGLSTFEVVRIHSDSSGACEKRARAYLGGGAPLPQTIAKRRVGNSLRERACRLRQLPPGSVHRTLAPSQI